MKTKPLILITNDDGVDSEGILVLTKLMMQLGDVVVFAPDGPRSGQSNAITVTQPIRFTKIQERKGLIRYSCNGTPTDCVKLALNEVLERKPDLLVSGINHGLNSAINVIYSGTMGAVFEGCENGLLSIGFSIDDHSAKPDFSTFEAYILDITRRTLENKLPYGICLNVNAPKKEIKGIKIARQTRGYWTKEFERRNDPRGGFYFWMTGYFQNEEPNAKDSDEWALKNNYISIVPTKIDMTAYEELNTLRDWGF